MRQQLILFLLLASLGIVGLGYHNWLRSGDPLTFGYSGQAFDTPPWEGIGGMLFSPGKSIFLYAPPLILSIWHFPRFWRRERRLAEAMVLAAIIALLFYGSWWAWHGGWCWGSRFLVPLIPLWMLPLGEGLIKADNINLVPTSPGNSGMTASNPIPSPISQGRWLLHDFSLRDIAPWVRGREQNATRRGWIGWGQLPLFAILGFFITLLGTFTDVNRHYARWGMVNYSIAGSPIIGAVRSLTEGHTERLGTFHLQDIGWLPIPASIFPAGLVLILLVGSIQMARQLSIKEVT